MDKITFNIASIPSRKNELIKTVASIINQVDKVNVALNCYSFNDTIDLKKLYPSVSFWKKDNTLGDAYKFAFVAIVDGYYLTGDDDLIYPKTYVKDMIKAIDKYGIVTHHSRSFNAFPISNYYHSATKRHRCLDEVKEIDTVQFGGTGVMGFHTKHFSPKFDIFKKSNMADIWVGIEVDRQGLPITVLPHLKDYIKYQPMDSTIWHDKHQNCDYETKVVNDYFGMK